MIIILGFLADGILLLLFYCLNVLMEKYVIMEASFL